MYQQQQFVERIRQTDKSILMAIATSLKQQEEMNDNTDHMNDHQREKLVLPEVLPDVDVLYRQVLHDAEEHLRRYEMLGLSRKSRKEEYKSTPPIVPNISSIPASPPASPPHSTHTTTSSNKMPAVSLPPTTTTITASPPSPPHHNTTSSSITNSNTKSNTMTTTTTTTTPHQKKPFKSFYKNKKNETISSGKRRSARNILAFGHRIPPMSECDFHLPMDEYGEQMEKRVNNKWKKKNKRKIKQ